MRVAAALGLLSSTAACGDDPVPPLPPITAVTFNVHGSDTIEDPDAGQAIADQLAGFAPDFALVQECVACDGLRSRMPARFRIVEAHLESALGILYDGSAWIPGASGVITSATTTAGACARPAGRSSSASRPAAWSACTRRISA